MTPEDEPPQPENLCRPDDTGRFFMNTIASSSRWLFLLSVLSSALIATALFVYGFILSITLVLAAFYFSVFTFQFSLEAMKHMMAASIEIMDIFLVATVFSIVSLGFYELFIAKAPLPGWLKICDLEDLKAKLLGRVIIALSVLLLGVALTWDGQSDILAFGLAIAAYLWVHH
jgi:uncharacterized membrane protein YqhA